MHCNTHSKIELAQHGSAPNSKSDGSGIGSDQKELCSNFENFDINYQSTRTSLPEFFI